jgi:enoyl-CoA hydratase
MSDPVLCEIDGGIATLTLNRPDKLNAINYAMADSLLAALDAIEADSGVGAIILTGAGERAFSAGADIHEFSHSARLGADTAVRDFVRRGQALTSRLEAFAKPVIAAVNGLALGGGCEITQAVHLAVASEQAVFGDPEIRLGMLPTFGGSQRLPRLVRHFHHPRRRRSAWSTRSCPTRTSCPPPMTWHDASWIIPRWRLPASSRQ